MIGPIDFLCPIDRFKNMYVTEADDAEAHDLANVILDVRETPDFIVHPVAIRREIDKFVEIKRTLHATLSVDPKAFDRPEVILLLINGRLITLLKCLIVVYNFFNVPNMQDPVERYSTLLDPESCPDLVMMFSIMDAVLMDDGIDSVECSHVLHSINETMKVIIDMLASIVGGGRVKSNVGKLREAYRSFHIRHKGEANGFEPSERLLKAFAKVADYLANYEGEWMQCRPEPTLRAPAFGLVAGRKIPDKIVAEEFDRSQNTICNWNHGRGRPYEYEGPYPDTPEGDARMRQDAELFRLRMRNKRTAEENRRLAEAYRHHAHYTQFKYDPLVVDKQWNGELTTTLRA